MRGTAATGSRYSFYLDATAYDGPWPYPAPWPAAARHLHIGSLTAVDPRHGASSLAAFKEARKHGTTSFDPNIRPLVTPDRDAARALVEQEVAEASIVKGSEEDLAWLYPGRALDDVLADWAGRRAALCRRHAGRRRRARAAGRPRLSPFPRSRSRSPTPWAPATVLCPRCWRRWTATAPSAPPASRPSESQLARWLAFAAMASAITCTRKGSDPPTLAEVEAKLKSASPQGR